MKKRNLAVLLGTGALLTFLGIYGAASASAQGFGGHSLIIERLAERFNLEPGEIENVFAECQEERRMENQARFEERLNNTVEAGNLTEEQKAAVLQKKEEMRERIEELKELSFEERREACQELHEEIKQWAEENGIDLGFFGPMGSFMRGNRQGFKSRWGPKL